MPLPCMWHWHKCGQWVHWTPAHLGCTKEWWTWTLPPAASCSPLDRRVWDVSLDLLLTDLMGGSNRSREARVKTKREMKTNQGRVGKQCDWEEKLNKNIWWPFHFSTSALTTNTNSEHASQSCYTCCLRDWHMLSHQRRITAWVRAPYKTLTAEILIINCYSAE